MMPKVHSEVEMLVYVYYLRVFNSFLLVIFPPEYLIKDVDSLQIQ